MLTGQGVSAVADIVCETDKRRHVSVVSAPDFAPVVLRIVDLLVPVLFITHHVPYALIVPPFLRTCLI